MSHSLLIFNARLLDESLDSPGAILIIEGKIRSVFQGYFTNLKTAQQIAKAVLKEDGFDENCPIEMFDAKGCTVTPAFIDMHVHFRDPGLTHKEDLNSGLHAAVCGGFGTVVCMPNTNPVISSIEQVLEVDKRALNLGLANLIQSASITKNFDGEDISHIENLTCSQVPLITEDGNDVLSSSAMLNGMKKAGEKGIIVACHCEDTHLAKMARPYRKAALEIMKKYKLSTWGGENIDDKDIPEEELEQLLDSLFEANDLLALAENIATERNIALARFADCHVHICHVSTAEALQTIKNTKQIMKEELDEEKADEADIFYDAVYSEPNVSLQQFKRPNFNLTCEATPHHIALCGNEDSFIRAMVNPPLRMEEDRLSVLEALRDGTIDCIATDHAPHTFEDKAKGAPGFTGLETAFAVCNTVLVKEDQLSAQKLSQLMSANPARILNLNKGVLKAGFDGDLTIFDPDEVWTVNPDEFCSKGHATPFTGRTLTGRVKTVFIGGKKIFDSIN